MRSITLHAVGLTLMLTLATAGRDARAQDAAPDAGTVITAHGVSVFGQPALPADFPHLPYVNPDAPKGGEMSQAVPGGFDSYNPFTIEGRAAALSSMMLESLMEGTADEIGTAYCLLCESVEYPESRDWVIFNLRPEARFSDGSPVTAEDVLFSFETFRDKGLSSFRTVINQSVQSAEVLDDRRVRFTFTPGYPRRDVIQSVAGIPILPRAEFEASGRDLERTSTQPMIGSGPYMFDSAQIGRSVVYRRNPDYWGRDLPINRGRHNFDRIRIEYFADPDAAFEAFKAGEYRFRNETSSLNWATGYDFPTLQAGHVVKAELPNGDKAPAQGFFFNLRREKFQDPRVREAIGLMFNFEWSNAALFYGLYDRVQSFWENSDLEAEGPPSDAEIALLQPVAEHLPDGILTDDAVLPPVSGERQLDRGNLRRAAALLDEAGWAVGADGVRRNAAGQSLQVEFLNDNQAFDRVISPFVENLRALGVDARLARVDNAEYTTRERRFEFDIVVGGPRLDLLPGDGLIQQFGSEAANGEFNTAGIANPAVDKLIRDVIASDSREALQASVRALDRALRALRPWVPNWFKSTHTVAYYDLYDHPETLPPYALGELDFWWYNEEKAETLRRAGVIR